MCNRKCNIYYFIHFSVAHGSCHYIVLGRINHVIITSYHITSHVIITLQLSHLMREFYRFIFSWKVHFVLSDILFTVILLLILLPSSKYLIKSILWNSLTLYRTIEKNIYIHQQESKLHTLTFLSHTV